MHQISRSQFYFEKIEHFLESNSDRLFLELYSNEVRRIQRQYKNLNLTKLGMVKAHPYDKRYHVVVTKDNQ